MDELQTGPDAAEIAKFIDCLRELATTAQDTPQYLVLSLSSTSSNGLVVRLPQLTSIERTIRNLRNAYDTASALRQTRQDFVIPQVYNLTLSGENLERSEHWCMEGTFKTIPQIIATSDFNFQSLNAEFPPISGSWNAKNEEFGKRVASEVRKPNLSQSSKHLVIFGRNPKRAQLK
ncbi:hypothetical protein QE152_g38582 [Popillia japonica]|uniref:Uncharacterized protein n=1 Tax=Popillia japonica TaxID=7064 RepID=A0AAW1HWM2_POPJA